jgi:transcriptional regulator with XRE-family HTH domain
VTRHLGDVVRQLREDAGLSMSRLARASGVDLASISRLENHKQHLLTRENLARVAQALGSTATELERLAGGNHLEAAPSRWPTVEEVLARDRNLTDAQRDAIMTVYRSYVRRR